MAQFWALQNFIDLLSSHYIPFILTQGVGGSDGKIDFARVREASGAGRIGDGQGLYLLVENNNAKSWIVRIQKDGKRRDIGLGSALKVSLSDARKKAAKIRADIEAGIDPVIQRNRERGIPTFKEAAKLVFEQNRKTWKNSQHKWQWMRTLEMFAFPQDCRHGCYRNALGNCSLGIPAQSQPLSVGRFAKKIHSSRCV